MERWQRALEGALERYAGPNSAGGRAFAIADVISFVVLLGTDHPDTARPTYIDGEEITAGAGVAAQLSLTADGGDVEILAAWASRPANQLNVLAFFEEIAPTGLVSINTTQSYDTQRSFGLFRADTNAAAAVEFNLTGPQATSVELPGIRGTILEQGRRLVFRQTSLADTLAGGFVWRNA